MKKEEKVRLPYVPTYGEEVANTVSHAVMLPLTLCLLPFAAVWTYLHDARPVLASVSVSVCVISIFLMLLASTLYHSMRPDSKHKAVFHKARPYLHLRRHRRNLYPRSAARDRWLAGCLRHRFAVDGRSAGYSV